MRTSTLTGADLNRAVAMALGLKLRCFDLGKPVWTYHSGPDYQDEENWKEIPDYAGDIATAWPIIEDRKIILSWVTGTRCSLRSAWLFVGPDIWMSQGATAPEAAMRCFVASVYGSYISLENP